MAAAGDRDSAYGTVISMAPSHCQSTFVLHDDDLWVEVLVALGEGAWIAGDDVENCGCPGAHRRPEAAKPVQRDALVAGEVTVADGQAADGRAGGGGVGVDADAGAGSAAR
jgi:hypothetical protein